MESETPVEKPLPANAPESGTTAAPGPGTDGIAAQVAAQHGATPGAGPGAAAPEKKKSGRPAIHGLYSKAAGSNGKNPVKVPLPLPGQTESPETEVELRSDTRVSIPPQLRDRIVKKLLTLAETSGKTLVEGQAVKAGLEEKEIEDQLKQTQLGEDNKAIVADLTPYVLQEWGMDDPEISPTLAVGLVLGPWLLGTTSAYLTLASLAQQRLELEKKKQKQTTPPNANSN